MSDLDKITRVLISLDVAGNQVLFIVLDDQGSITRKGDGSANSADPNLYIGITSEKLFEQLKPLFTAEMQKFLGRGFDHPDKKGRLCTYKVLFGGPEFETGTQFQYGELSQGIPTPFRNLTYKALELTEKWFQAQKKMVVDSKKTASKSPEKPWWKFW